MASGFFNRIRGFLEVVTSFPSGTTNDGIFGLTNSGTNYLRNRRGVVTAEEAGIAYDGTDQTTRLNAVFATAKIKSILFDHAESLYITVSGTVNFQGKKLIMKNGNAFIGAGTLSNGVLDCDLQSQCVATSITIVNFKSVRTEFSCENFGAQGNGTDETAIIQKTSDTLIKNPAMPRTIRMFPGKVYATQGWVWHNWNGTRYDQFNLNLLGTHSTYESNPGFCPSIQALNVNGFAINVQRATGFSIRGINFFGPINLASKSGTWAEYYGRNYYTLSTSVGGRASQWSPGTLIGIDLFTNTGYIPPDGGYPDWNGTTTSVNTTGTNWYRGLSYEGSAGSSGGTIEDISIAGQTVCLMVSPNGQSQQAENMVFRNIYGGNCQAVFGFGQRESKNCFIYGGYSIDRVGMIIDGLTWGAGQGSVPNIDGWNSAGGTVAIFNISCQHSLRASNIYTENLYRIGFIQANPGTFKFLSCNFSFNTEEICIPGQGHWSGAGIHFDSCILRYYDDLFDKRLCFRGTGHFATNCFFDLPPFTYLGATDYGTVRMVAMDFDRCYYRSTVYGSSLLAWPTLNGWFGESTDFSAGHGRITLQNANTYFKPNVFASYDFGHYDKFGYIYFGGTAVYTVNSAAHTATINWGGSVAPNLRVGAYMLVYDSTTTNTFDTLLGRVSNIDHTTKVISLVDVPLNVLSGTTDRVAISDFKRMKKPFTGKYIAGTNTITNVFAQSAITTDDNDIWTDLPIVNWNGVCNGTGVITLAENYTAADDELYTPRGDNEIVTYFKGGTPLDGSNNSDPTAYFPGNLWVVNVNTVLPGGLTGIKKRTFRCLVSGFISATTLGATKQSQWEEIGVTTVSDFIAYNSATSNFTLAIPHDRMVKGLLVSVVGGSGATVSVGTTPGGIEFMNAETIAAGGRMVINEPVYTDTGGITFYVTGTFNGGTVYLNVF